MIKISVSKTLLPIAAGAALLLTQASAHATLMFSGAANLTFQPGSAITSLSGTFAGAFDDSVVTGAPVEFFNGTGLTSFTLSPNPLGTTLFDTSNVGYRMTFVNGVFNNISVGGIVSNAANTITDNTDDFQFNINAAGGLTASGNRYSIATEAGIISSDTANGTLTVTVPEPATFAIFGLGLAGLMGFSRNKKA